MTSSFTETSSDIRERVKGLSELESVNFCEGDTLLRRLEVIGNICTECVCEDTDNNVAEGLHRLEFDMAGYEDE